MTKCTESGCRNLENRCLDCGRLVCDYLLHDGYKITKESSDNMDFKEIDDFRGIVKITPNNNSITHIPFTKEELWELHSLLQVLENKGYFELEKNAYNAFMKIKEGLKFYE